MCLTVMLRTKRNNIVNGITSRVAQRNYMVCLYIESAVCHRETLDSTILTFSLCAS